MFPLLLLVPGGVLIWVIAQRLTERRLEEERGGAPPRTSWWGSREHHHRHYGREREPRFMLAPRASTRRQLTTADYLAHLHESIAACRIVDTVKQYALAGDVSSLMQTGGGRVGHAMNVLGAPMPVLFAQRDLNVLGATPELPEDGRMDSATREALRSLQQKFGLPVTGEIDYGTAFALRYSVGCIHSQDRAEALGNGMGV